MCKIRIFRGSNHEYFASARMMYINSISSLPVILIVACLSHEVPHKLLQYPGLFSLDFQIQYFGIILFACFFSYSIFLSSKENSALSTILVGVMKSAITTIIGFYTFGGVEPTRFMVIGQVLNLLGGTIYALEKYKLKIRGDYSKLPVASENSET